MKVQENAVVGLSFTVHDDKGSKLDERDRSTPMYYLHGKGQLIPGLERALDGRESGATFRVHLEPGDAYGERRDLPTLEIGAGELPEGVAPQVGTLVMANGPDDKQMALWISDVKNGRVTLDANNPLAGENLHFKVTVVSVRDASPQELSAERAQA